MAARKSLGAALLGSLLAATGCASAPKAPDTAGLPAFSLESYSSTNASPTPTAPPSGGYGGS